MRDNLTAGPDVPAGFVTALARNPDAMDVFSAMSLGQRQQVLAKSRRIRSADEMRSYVDSLVGLDPGQFS